MFVSSGSPFQAFVVTAAVVIATARPAVAQDVAPLLSRADVRAETLAAARAHLLMPAGEGDSRQAASAIPSTTTRKQIRSETQQAARDGTLIPAGESGAREADRRATTIGSVRPRAEVNAETLAAIKAHRLIPAGEGAYPAWN